MPEKISNDVIELAKQYSKVIETTDKKIGVFYYAVDDDTRAAACAIANALDGDCIPISKRTGDKDNIFIFSRISRYDIVIFGTPLINNRVPETFERFLTTTKGSITCKSFHLFITAAKTPADPFKELQTLFASIKTTTMPVHPTSTVLIDSKTINRFVGKAMLCVSSELQYQEIMKVLGFHLYHHHHRHGCSHLKSCKHRHIRKQSPGKKLLPKAPKNVAEETTSEGDSGEEKESLHSEPSPKAEKEEKSSGKESSSGDSDTKSSEDSSNSQDSTENSSSDDE